MKRNKIILTGASGFIGRYVLDELSKNPSYEIHCIVNQNKLPDSSENIYQHKFNLLDFSKDSDHRLQLLLNEIKPESCLHLAWYTGHKDYLVSSLNLDWQKASIRLIDSFYGSGGKRLLSTGTCIEYSLKEPTLHQEQTTAVEPETFYAQCKMNVLNHLKGLAEIKKINYLWARIYFIYGPGEQSTRLVPYIINSLQNNKEAKPNNGKAYRDYIFVKDLSRQLIALLETSAEGIVNTGSGHPIPVQEIFNKIGKLLGKEQLVVTDEQVLGPTVPSLIAPDLKLFNTYVKQFNLTSLEEGLKETIESYKR